MYIRTKDTVIKTPSKPLMNIYDPGQLPAKRRKEMYKIITPVVTVLDQHEKPDHEANKKVIDFLVNGGVDGILVLLRGVHRRPRRAVCGDRKHEFPGHGDPFQRSL